LGRQPKGGGGRRDFGDRGGSFRGGGRALGPGGGGTATFFFAGLGKREQGGGGGGRGLDFRGAALGRGPNLFFFLRGGGPAGHAGMRLKRGGKMRLVGLSLVRLFC